MQQKLFIILYFMNYTLSSLESSSLTQKNQLIMKKSSQELYATNRVKILHQHCKVSRYSGISILREAIVSVKHYHQMVYSVIILLYIFQKQHSTSLCPSETFTSPTQYFFLTIYLSKNNRQNSIKKLTISTEAITITTFPSPYITQTYFVTTIITSVKYLLVNFYDNHSK